MHASDTVGTNSPAYNAAYARDIGGIDVLGYTANDFQITDENWQLGVITVEEFNEPGRFVCYPVQEWCGSSTAGGDHNVVFLGDVAPDFPYNQRGEHNRTFGHAGVWRLTGVIADRLDRSTIARALRARHTWATTGEHTALLVRCGEHLQGDAFAHRGAATVDYRFLGQSGWEEIAAYDHTGQIWHRNLHEELGYSDRLIRLRWGGARIPDRYRWAAWQGRITILNGTINRFQSHGFEHGEEVCWRAGLTDIVFRSDTYGDADSVEIDISNLRHCTIKVEGAIDSYVKVGDSLELAKFTLLGS